MLIFFAFLDDETYLELPAPRASSILAVTVVL